MPFFVQVGKNGSRGWSATRRGTDVIIQWGPIEVLHPSLRRLAYAWVVTNRLPRLKVYRCGSASAARCKYVALKAKKTRIVKHHENYVQLAAGQRIRIRRPHWARQARSSA